MRCAIYSRFSSEGQNAQSAGDQTAACRRFAAAMGWQVAEVYEDHALSGASRFRPEYLRLLQDAEGRRFEVVLCEALDRLGGRLSDIADMYNKLSFRGIAIHTMQQGLISQMHIGLLGTMSQLFLSDLRHKTHRGLEAVARDGRSAGGLCFGYKVSDLAGADGKARRGGRIIDPEQAAVVVRIFEQYAVGVSPKRIALDLNAKGISGPRGGGWAPSAINGNRHKGTGILNNEAVPGNRTDG
ncbi:recombinase family protein [Paeniroseomonas aquatica]|uniref:Recombinase family protein n=1 Tax=Paeniroseomonas aquatica TaxID=373043 RepID=A0ABT8AG99_9PROT|nr:recombinase family protein [Paeniroseomonas aquatica]MDN3568486.1 recombinase family protein [Paeniroseomonas aquatica]